MTYELAKQLKDAGFPLIKVSGFVVASHGKTFCTLCGFPFLEIDGEYFLQPVLDVLIEACGDGFTVLERTGDWFTKEYGEDRRWMTTQDRNWKKQHTGKTPEEAVAKLWLALNEKK